MNWKNRLTNYNFWISIVSAALLILQAFKFEFDIAYINEIVTAVLGLLVVIGIISDPTRTSTKQSNADAKSSLNASSNVKSSQEQNNVPSDDENEDGNIHSQDDIKNLVEKISNDLDKKMEELSKLNILTKNLNANDEKVEKINEEVENVLEQNCDIAELNNVEKFNEPHFEESLEENNASNEDEILNNDESLVEVVADEDVPDGIKFEPILELDKEENSVEENKIEENNQENSNNNEVSNEQPKEEVSTCQNIVN